MGAVDVEAHGRHRWMSRSVIDAHIPCGALSLYHAVQPCTVCTYWLIFMSGCHPKYVCHLARPSALLLSPTVLAHPSAMLTCLVTVRTHQLRVGGCLPQPVHPFIVVALSVTIHPSVANGLSLYGSA